MEVRCHKHAKIQKERKIRKDGKKMTDTFYLTCIIIVIILKLIMVMVPAFIFLIKPLINDLVQAFKQQ